MCLDQCIASPATKDQAAEAMQRSLNWARRCRLAHPEGQRGTLFAIVQGGLYRDLRLESAAQLVEMGFAGIAVGGLAVGESAAEREQVLDLLKDQLPTNSPRYLMGVGKPTDIVAAVMRGIDMFDCVLPTRNARNGTSSPPGACCVCATAATATTRGPSMKIATATAAATSAAPTCTTSSAATNSWPRGSPPSTTCASTCGCCSSLATP